MRDRRTLRVEQPQIRETVLGERPVAVVGDPERLGAFEQGRVDGQPLRSAPRRRDPPFTREMERRACRLCAEHGRRQTESRYREPADPDHAVPFGFESTNFWSASDTSASESARPTNDATR